MALVRGNKANIGNTANQTTYTTASFSLSGDELLIAFLQHNVGSGTCGVHTINAAGTTLSGIVWTAINSATWGSSSLDRLTAWWGQATEATTGVLVWSIAGTTPAGACASVFAYTGHAIADPVSAHVAMNDTDATAGPIDLSALTGDLSVWGAARNTNATDGAHTGATIIHNPVHASPTRNLITMEEAGENSPSVTWASSFQARIIGFKIRELKFPLGVTPASLTVAVSFGTPTLAFGGITVTPPSLTVPVVFTAPLVAGGVATTALTVAVSFGVPTLIIPLKVLPTMLTIPVNPGDATLVFASGVSFSPLSLVFLSDFGSATLRFGVAATAVTVPVTFGTPALRLGVATTGLVVPVAFGTPTITGQITTTGLTVAVTFGTPTPIFTGATLTPASLTVPVTFTTPTLAGRVAPLALTVTVAFGTPSLAIRLAPVALSIPVSFTSPTVSGRITTTALSVTVTLGTPTAVIPGATLTPLALPVTVAFGNTVLSIPGAPLTVAPSGLSTAITFGSPTLSFVPSITVTPASLTVACTFGTPTVRSVITVPSLATFTAFGSPTLAFPLTVTTAAVLIPVSLGSPTLVLGTAAQTLTPVTDITTGVWTTDTGSTTGLAAALADMSESNYIQSEDDPVDSPYVVALTDALDPGVGTGHVVSWSHRNPGPGDLDLLVDLRQGYVSEASKGSLKAQWEELAIPSTFTTVTKTLSVAEANSITDYNDLFLRFKANAPGEPVFSPADLSGLAVWLDAADYSPGSWNNRGSDSAPTIVGTPAMTVSANTLNGLPLVRFTMNEGRIRGGWSHGVYDWTLIYLVRFIGPNIGRAFSVQYPPSNALVGFHSAGRDLMYDNGTWIYSPAGTTWAGYPAPGPWMMYGADSESGLGMQFFIDGAAVGSRTGGTGGLTNGWGISGYDATGTPETMDIELAEMVLYDRRLDDAERIQVEEYLQAKWITPPAVTVTPPSLTATIAFGSPALSFASAFSPIDITELLTWLDATQITGKSDGDAVSTWEDSSGNNLDATIYYNSVAYRTAGINGHPAVRFGEAGVAEMRIDHGHLLGSRTVFQVVKVIGTFGAYATTQLQGLEPYMQTYSMGGVIHTYTNPDLNSGVSWSGGGQLITVWCDTATSTQGLKVDATVVTSAWTPQSSTAWLQLGSNSVASYGMDGWIGEIIIYERKLSDAERIEVETYLTEKWGL